MRAAVSRAAGPIFVGFLQHCPGETDKHRRHVVTVITVADNRGMQMQSLPSAESREYKLVCLNFQVGAYLQVALST